MVLLDNSFNLKWNEEQELLKRDHNNSISKFGNASSEMNAHFFDCMKPFELVPAYGMKAPANLLLKSVMVLRFIF